MTNLEIKVHCTTDINWPKREMFLRKSQKHTFLERKEINYSYGCCDEIWRSKSNKGGQGYLPVLVYPRNGIMTGKQCHTEKNSRDSIE